MTIRTEVNSNVRDCSAPLGNKSKAGKLASQLVQLRQSSNFQQTLNEAILTKTLERAHAGTQSLANKKDTCAMHTDDAIRSRKTVKILASQDLPEGDHRNLVNEILLLAGQAPFHRACEEYHRQSNSLTGIEPWRFYALDAGVCRKLRTQIPLENAGKIPAMLAAADSLIMATWLPNAAEVPDMDGEPGFAATINNMEHIAAASAAVQNLLLAATARGVSNYWSSGGVLRSAQVFSLLGIPRSQILLGAIFLFPIEYGGAELATSKLREHRSPSEAWSRWVTLD